jgi:hypothetical protein
MLAVNPSLSPADVETILEATADGDRPTMAAGWGSVDAPAALACARTVDPPA